MTILDHARSLLSISVVTVNLVFWLPLLVLVALVKLVLSPARRLVDPLLDGIYRSAVRIDDLWLRRVMRIEWDRPDHGLRRDAPTLVLANHVCWADILILQSVLSRTGPLLKFLAKRELLWMPIFGIVFWAFDFPLLRRRATGDVDEETRRRADAAALETACAALRRHPAALLTFAEGTRFSEEKRVARESPYQTLLPPKVGGLASLRDALDGAVAEIVDVTLAYPEDASFWRFLCGRVSRVEVDVDRVPIDDVPRERDAMIEWLDERWRRKDRLILEYRGR